MRRVGLADVLGLVGVLVPLMWLVGAVDSASYPKLLVLVAGGLGVAPAVVHRWLRLGRPTALLMVPLVALAFLVTWSVISALASGAPASVSLFGWWLRADGVLGTIAAAFLLLGAVTLSRAEVERTISWMLGGAALVAFFGLLQLAGMAILGSPGRTVLATLGNANFAAGYFAIMTPLAVGRALKPATSLLRAGIWVLAGVLAVLAVATLSTQGPVATLAGLAGLALAWLLMTRGSRQRTARLVVLGVVLAGVAALVATWVGTGPFSIIRNDENALARIVFWQAGWNTMLDNPVLGTGPGSFARYVAESRPESFIAVSGGDMRPSAVHNIFLQFGATLGWPGLLAWFTLFVGTLAYLARRLMAGTIESRALAASLVGAVTAYLVQGLVSIDVPSLIAVGWLVTGLAIAAVREPAVVPVPVAPEPSRGEAGRRSKKAGRKPSPVAPRKPQQPAWIPATGVALALVGATVVGMQINHIQGSVGELDGERAVALMRDPWLPCPLRVELAMLTLKQLGPDAAKQAAIDAADLDPRCPPMINIKSEVALTAGDLPLADAATRYGLEIDPYLGAAWGLRAQYLERAGDAAGAAEARAEHVRLTELAPTPAEPAATETTQPTP